MTYRRLSKASWKRSSAWLLLLMSLDFSLTRSQNVFGAPGYLAVVPATSMPSKSLLICSMICRRKACTTFYQKDNHCHIAGVRIAEVPAHQIYISKDRNDSYAYQILPPGLPAIASTTYTSAYAPSKGVDTDLGTWFCSGFNIGHSWWRLDLEVPRYIHKIDMLPRNDPADAGNFQDIEIRIGTTALSSGDFTPWALLAHYKGPYTPADGRLIFTSDQGIPGRYISVQRGVNVVSGALKILDFRVYVRVH